MQNNDTVRRFVFDNLDMRGCIVSLSESIATIQQTHHYPPELAKVLNEFALAAVLLHDSLKIDCSVTIQLRSTNSDDLPISLIMADCMTDRKVRAIAEYDNELLKPGFAVNLSDLTGALVLAITITPHEGDRYQSIVAMEHDSLANCLESYFQQSEQLPTWFAFFAQNERGLGIALHSLPKEKVTDEAITLEGRERLKILLNTLTEKEAFGLSTEQILTRLFHDEACRVFDPSEVAFGCVCSAEKSLNAIKSLGLEEARALLAEQSKYGEDGLFVDCHFCFQRYDFSPRDIALLFSEKSEG